MRRLEMNLRILTKDNKSTKYENVVEYVQGRQFFYVNMSNGKVLAVPRNDISVVFRYTNDREWPINLKRRFGEDDDVR